jgi:hypothetical protein
LDNDLHFLDGHLWICAFRENDADRNSRTCLAARSARRDDSRRDLGRDRAKEAAKMNVERVPSWTAGRLCPVFKEKVGGDKALSETSGIAMPRAKKHPKLSADERAFLNRLDCLNEEEIKQLTTREIFAYFKIIDKVDSRADVRRMMERAK